MKKYYNSEEHYVRAMNKMIINRTGKTLIPSLSGKLVELYKYDELFNPSESSCSKLYLAIYYEENLTHKQIVGLVKGASDKIEPFKDTDIWKETYFGVYSSEYVENIDSIKQFGLYFLYDENKKLIYIGQSTSSLHERSTKSLRLRKARYIKYAYPKTKSDTLIYEVYYITKYKPMLNRLGIEDDESTLVVEDIDTGNILKIYNQEYTVNVK